MYSYEHDYEYDAEKMFGIITKNMKENGYVTLSYVDVKQILESNFQEKFKKYYILNVCKPIAAKELLSEDERMGLFLPCKITISETKSGSHVSFLRVSKLAKDYLNVESKAKKYEEEMISILEKI
ncbi:MAG: DUF302 domain-containing protein [Thermoplasmataceae archaeon]